MVSNIKALALSLGVFTVALSMAQSPATATPPAGSTGLCKDGAYWQGPTKQGACRGHHGVQDWYGTGAAPAASTPAAAAAATSVAIPAATAPVAAAPAPTPAVAATWAAPAPTAKTVAPAAAPAVAAAPGGGAGQVWGNKTSKVYHCSTDRWYGKTKNGEYLTEAAAVAQGYRPDHGKACH